MYKILYERNSSGDIGTLYQARNFLHAINSPHHPMDDPDAAIDFIEKYTISLILACYKTSESCLGVEEPRLKHEKEQTMEKILSHITDKYALPQTPDFTDLKKGLVCKVCNKAFKRLTGLRKHSFEKHNEAPKDQIVAQFPCPHCPKTYKKRVNLKSHMQAKHDGITSFVKEPETSNETEVEAEDCIFNYSRNALALGLLCLDFVNARKSGDGERVLTLYKFMMLIFKLTGSTKYAFYTLYTQAQVNFLVPDDCAKTITHERFVNTQGKMHTNVEIDRFMEHWNKKFKSDCKGMVGKLTQKSIDRVSGSYEAMDRLFQSFDSEISVYKGKGQHKKVDATTDVVELSKQFVEHKIFERIVGRQHRAFPQFKENTLQDLNTMDLSNWIEKSVDRISNFAVFQQFKRK